MPLQRDYLWHSKSDTRKKRMKKTELTYTRQIPHTKLTPSSVTENCACGHPYWKHTLTKSELERAFISNHALFRGGQLDAGCGGFYPNVSKSLS